MNSIDRAIVMLSAVTTVAWYKDAGSSATANTSQRSFESLNTLSENQTINIYSSSEVNLARKMVCPIEALKTSPITTPITGPIYATGE